ncbi:MAG: efflux RND transporter periplasmic adaptor subunit [Prevotellaceae bacterium]|nr:efflux RND transporter periplasmic adaptor subunit [Prevotellaceae bacterium]
MKLSKYPSLPALALVVLVVAAVAVCSLYAFADEQETLQGQVEVTEYRVSSKVPARLKELRVAEGDFVRRGDTLALLSAPEVEAKLAQARAAEAAAAAQEEKAEKGAREEQKRAAFELWNKARAGLEIAQKSHRRVKALYEAGVTTAQKFDEASAQLAAAEASERAARSQYDMARNGAEREDKAAARALTRRAAGAVSEVTAYVGETVLTAAHDGEVSEIFPVEGELVGAGGPVMNVARMDRMWVSLNVREDFLQRFAVGAEVKAVVPALGGREVRLKVYHLADLGSYAVWRATKTTGGFDLKTFGVRLRPVSPVEGLRPGMSVVVSPAQ